jgi:LuxR family transcriptional regulator
MVRRVADLLGGALTQRERQVLELVACGMTSHELGKVLGIAFNTVRTYQAHILRKLGAKTAAHAVAIAYLRGILSLEVA